VGSDDPRLEKEHTGSIDAAAKTLEEADPDAAGRVKARAESNPLASGKEKLEDEMDRRDDRESLERVLDAAVRTATPEADGESEGTPEEAPRWAALEGALEKANASIAELEKDMQAGSKKTSKAGE
jgi:hypothetical protein